MTSRDIHWPIWLSPCTGHVRHEFESQDGSEYPFLYKVYLSGRTSRVLFSVVFVVSRVCVGQDRMEERHVCG